MNMLETFVATVNYAVQPLMIVMLVVAVSVFSGAVLRLLGLVIEQLDGRK